MTVFGDPDVVPLWFGEGDLVTPEFVRVRRKGIAGGRTFYTWQRGIIPSCARRCRPLPSGSTDQMPDRPHFGNDRRHEAILLTASFARSR